MLESFLDSALLPVNNDNNEIITIPRDSSPAGPCPSRGPGKSSKALQPCDGNIVMFL